MLHYSRTCSAYDRIKAWATLSAVMLNIDVRSDLKYTVRLSLDLSKYKTAATGSIIVMHRGTIVHEEYRTKSDHDGLVGSYSMAKQITSMLFSMCVKKRFRTASGHFVHFDTPLRDLWMTDGPEIWASITPRKLIQMKSGMQLDVGVDLISHNWRFLREQLDPESLIAVRALRTRRFVLCSWESDVYDCARKRFALLERKSFDDRFHYCSENFILLGIVVQRLVQHNSDVSGPAYRQMTRFAHELWLAANTTHARLLFDEKGNYKGDVGVAARPRDWACLGQLMLSQLKLAFYDIKSSRLFDGAWLRSIMNGTESGDTASFYPGPAPEGPYNTTGQNLLSPTQIWSDGFWIAQHSRCRKPCTTSAWISTQVVSFAGLNGQYVLMDMLNEVVLMTASQFFWPLDFTSGPAAPVMKQQYNSLPFNFRAYIETKVLQAAIRSSAMTDWEITLYFQSSEYATLLREQPTCALGLVGVMFTSWTSGVSCNTSHANTVNGVHRVLSTTFNSVTFAVQQHPGTWNGGGIIALHCSHILEAHTAVMEALDR